MQLVASGNMGYLVPRPTHQEHRFWSEISVNKHCPPHVSRTTTQPDPEMPELEEVVLAPAPGSLVGSYETQYECYDSVSEEDSEECQTQ